MLEGTGQSLTAVGSYSIEFLNTQLIPEVYRYVLSSIDDDVMITNLH